MIRHRIEHGGCVGAITVAASAAAATTAETTTKAAVDCEDHGEYCDDNADDGRPSGSYESVENTTRGGLGGTRTCSRSCACSNSSLTECFHEYWRRNENAGRGASFCGIVGGLV